MLCFKIKKLLRTFLFGTINPIFVRTQLINLLFATSIVQIILRFPNILDMRKLFKNFKISSFHSQPFRFTLYPGSLLIIRFYQTALPINWLKFILQIINNDSILSKTRRIKWWSFLVCLFTIRGVLLIIVKFYVVILFRRWHIARCKYILWCI